VSAASEESLLDLHGAAGLLGAYCAIERALFELTGALAGTAELDDPEVLVFLDGLSGEHAWHAELWSDRLPVLSSIDPRTLVTVPEPAGRALDDLRTRPPIAQIAGLVRVVLPRLISSYARHEAAASPAAERPTLRALRLVLRDEIEAWVAGEGHLERLLDTPKAVREAVKVASALEVGLAEASLTRGLVPWPGRRA
jgi:hypothetical protein